MFKKQIHQIKNLLVRLNPKAKKPCGWCSWSKLALGVLLLFLLFISYQFNVLKKTKSVVLSNNCAKTENGNLANLDQKTNNSSNVTASKKAPADLFKKGPYKVKKIRNIIVKSNETFVNQILPQQVLLDIHFPDVEVNDNSKIITKFPLIIISHPTVTASMEPARKEFDYLTEQLVTYGYVVAMYEWSLDMGQCEIFRNAEREKNIVDYLEGKTTDPFSPFYKLIDTNNIGLIGHSNGSFAQYFARTDNRVRAFIGLSGLICEWGGLYSDIVDLDKPFMYIGGTKDQLRADTKRMRFYGLWDAHVGPKIMFDIKDGDHWQFTDDYVYYPDVILHYSETDTIFKNLYQICQKELQDADPTNDQHCKENYINREEQHKITNYFITAFLEKFLKNNNQLGNFLKNPPEEITKNIVNFSLENFDAPKNASIPSIKK